MNILLQKYFEFIKSFLPKPDENAFIAIGLDIGSSECRYVKLIRSDEGYSIIGWDSQPTKSTDITGSVKALFEKDGQAPENLYTAIAGKGTLIRYISMPKMSAEDAQASFAIESEKYFPFSKDQIFTDCYVLDPNTDEENISLMAAASKKDLVNERMSLLTDLSVNSEFVGINSIALANAVSVLGSGFDTQEDTAVGVLDMGDTISSLTIMYNNVPQFSRDIYIGGHELTKRISNTLGIEYNEATALKLNPKGREEDVLTACESPLSNIVQEIRLSFDYFASEKNIEVSQLVLAGGCANMHGLVDMFKQNLEINVEVWNPLNVLKVSEDIDENAIKESISKLGVALGLALYHYD